MFRQSTNTESDTQKKLVFGIIAGEASGDILGAGLISELKNRFPHAEFVGIGGSLMRQAGLRSLHDMERLSVMGFIDPLKRLPELLNIRSCLLYTSPSPRDA